MIRRTLKSLVHRVPYIRGLRSEIDRLRGELKRQGEFSAGHYYSTIPAPEDLDERLDEIDQIRDIPEIDLKKEAQRELLGSFASLYQELPYRDEPVEGFRYYFKRGWFSYSDAIFLHCMLRHFGIHNVVEVGSGVSSSVMLDTFEHFGSDEYTLTFVEPYPERLKSLVDTDGNERVTLFEMPVQQAPLEIFEKLSPGDLLFVDSSHVMKCRSDLQHIFNNILPRIQPGVFVHFHDIFFPFEYPQEWLRGGRYWNECYLLRAFLAYNDSWEIVLFGDYMNKEYGEFIETNLPLCRKNFGGSIYLRRVK